MKKTLYLLLLLSPLSTLSVELTGSCVTLYYIAGCIGISGILCPSNTTKCIVGSCRKCSKLNGQVKTEHLTEIVVQPNTKTSQSKQLVRKPSNLHTFTTVQTAIESSTLIPLDEVSSGESEGRLKIDLNRPKNYRKSNKKK